MILHSRGKSGTGFGFGPVLALLIVAVVAPTLCLLWLMNQATRNERLAVRQKLEDTYRVHLRDIRVRLESWWQTQTSRITTPAPDVAAADRITQIMEVKLADSFILRDGKGQLIYPVPLHARITEPDHAEELEEWQQAERLEIENLPLEAANAYEAIAGRAVSSDPAARALLAQARCLVMAGQRESAVAILIRQLADVKYRDAIDPDGRLIVPAAQLLALEILGRPSEPGYEETARSLRERLLNYRDLTMPAVQRVFLMERLASLPGQKSFERLEADRLAIDYIEKLTEIPAGLTLIRSPLDAIWQLASADRTVIALFKESRLVTGMAAVVSSSTNLPDAEIRILPGNETSSRSDLFLREPVGKFLPNWEFSLRLVGPNPFTRAADRQIAVYWWTGTLVIVGCITLLLFLTRHLGRQVRLTRLKNDLIATVSHELKTPLSSVRILVDTLLENECRDPRQTREYLELIARENQRLSRLIDNFLTFSRMERNKRAFEMRDLDPAEVAREAVAALRERFEAAGFQLDVVIDPGLPIVVGDRDALVTVLINLLDNAMKYSRDDKRLALRIAAEAGRVRMVVEDHGIGLSRRDIRRIFDRFYQVDQSLSREAGGCGLGLSIVQFIIDAHGGTIDVESRPGVGSVFTVWLPAREPGITRS